MSVICPICYKSETEGTLFCPACGTKMFSDKGVFTTIIKHTDTISEKPIVSANDNLPVFTDEDNLENKISLQIINSGQILPLIGRNEYSLGRFSEGQPLLPDIDLSPFDAHLKGVSRLHALINIKKDKVFLLDLNSSNGTMVNQEKIEPEIEKQIRNGDVIKLGKLRIQAILREV